MTADQAVRFGPAKRRATIAALVLAPVGLALLMLAGQVAMMPDGDASALPMWFGAAGLVAVIVALWLAARGLSRRVGLTVGGQGVLLHSLRPKRPDVVMPWADLLALHHDGSVGAPGPVRLVLSQRADGRATSAVRQVDLGTAAFDRPDAEVVAAVLAGWAAAGHVVAAGPDGRSWAVDQTGETVT